MFGLNKKTEMPTQESALPGREMNMPVPPQHFVLGTEMLSPWPENTELAMFGMGCFGGPSASFGRRKVCIRPKSVMPLV